MPLKTVSVEFYQKTVISKDEISCISETIFAILNTEVVVNHDSTMFVDFQVVPPNDLTELCVGISFPGFYPFRIWRISLVKCTAFIRAE